MPHAYCFGLEESKEALVAAYLTLARAVPVWRLATRSDSTGSADGG